MYRKLLFVALLASMLVATLAGSVSAQEPTNESTIHPDASRGVEPNGEVPLIGGIALIPLPDEKSGIVFYPLNGGLGIEGVDDGNWAIHAQKREWSNQPPDFVHWANEWGCNDAWAGWNNVSSTKIFNLGVWSTNWINQAHINLHNGLDGIASCVNQNCTVRLCSKHTFGANAWSEKLNIP